MNAAGLIAWYDRLMALPVYRELFEGSGFFNFGYWAAGVRSQHDASAALVEQLLAWAPDGPGAIADLACGLGATTAMALACRPQMRVVGVNLSRKQLQAARTRAPSARLAVMDAAQPGLRSESVDCVLCVEAAFHFRTRAQFLAEAARILRPGGTLLLSDILFRKLSPREGPYVPAANHVKSVALYREAVEAAGFVNVQVVDATPQTWLGHRRYVVDWAWDRLHAGRIGPVDLCRALSFPVLGSLLIERYLLVSARRP